MRIDQVMSIIAGVGIVMTILILGGCGTTGGFNYKGVQVTMEMNTDIKASEGSSAVSNTVADGEEVPDHQQGSDVAVPLVKELGKAYRRKLEAYENLVERCLKEGKSIAECQGEVPDIPEFPGEPVDPDSPVPPIEPPVEPPVEPEPPVEKPPISHYNTASWDNEGTSIILCPGDTAESASITPIGSSTAEPLTLHGSLDKGREVWTDYDTINKLGLAEIRYTDGRVVRFDINKAGGITRFGC